MPVPLTAVLTSLLCSGGLSLDTDTSMGILQPRGTRVERNPVGAGLLLACDGLRLPGVCVGGGLMDTKNS